MNALKMRTRLGSLRVWSVCPLDDEYITVGVFQWNWAGKRNFLDFQEHEIEVLKVNKTSLPVSDLVSPNVTL